MSKCRICGSQKRQNQYRVCRVCESDWRMKVDKQKKSRVWHQEQYDKLVEAGHPEVCGICSKPPKSRRLNLDYDHTTGNVRGLLCYKCNYGLSWFQDNLELLRAAARYVEK